MRSLASRSGGETDFALAFLFDGNVALVRVVVVLDVLGITIDRRLTARRGVGGKERVEPGQEGPHLG